MRRNANFCSVWGALVFGWLGLALASAADVPRAPACNDNFTPIAGPDYAVQNVTVNACLANGLRVSPFEICGGYRTRFAVRVASTCHESLLQIDFGDGNGYRFVTNGSVVNVSYRSVGKHTIRATAYPTINRAAILNVTGLTIKGPDQILRLEGTYKGMTYTGEAGLYLADPAAGIYNPVVIPDGFDPGNKRNLLCLYSLLNRRNLIEENRQLGRDFILVDFHNGAGDIEVNAMVLVDLIQQLNAMKKGLSPIAVIGPSMGGLIARYALTYMEYWGLTHDAAVFIAFDSPQKGANIPLGDQYFLKYFSKNSPGAAENLAKLRTPAARQMLLYLEPNIAIDAAPEYNSLYKFLTAGEWTAATRPASPHSDKIAFFNVLRWLGDFPALPRKVSISNGSGYGIGQAVSPGALLVNYSWSHPSGVADVVGRPRAAPDGSGRIFYGKIALGTAKDGLDVSVVKTLPWDSAPGGQRSTSWEIAAERPKDGDILNNSGAEAFIPTVSALAIDGSNGALNLPDPFYNVAADPDIMSKTPFDAIYYPVQNQEHVCITPQNKAWIMEEVAYTDRYRAALLTTIGGVLR